MTDTARRQVRRLRRRLGGRGLLAILGSALLLAGAVGIVLAVHDEQFQLEGDTAVDASPPDTLPNGDPNPFANTDFDWESLFADPSDTLTGPGNRPVEVSPLPNANFKDAEFIGKAAYLEQRRASHGHRRPPRRVVPLGGEGPRPPRPLPSVVSNHSGTHACVRRHISVKPLAGSWA